MHIQQLCRIAAGPLCLAVSLTSLCLGAAPIEDISGRPANGGNSGTIASGTWSGGGVWNATIEDDVYIYTELDANNTPANGHGIYGNGTNATTGGNYIKIDVSGPDGDGIRSNPGGITNAGSSNCTFDLGDYLTVWVRGESSDCVNLNGYSRLTVGDNASFYAWGTFKSGGEGSHGLRANYASQITTGSNTYIETTGEKSHGVYTAAGFFYPNATTASITLGNNASILTKNTGSHAVYAASKDSVVTFRGDARMTTEQDGSYGIYAYGSAASVNVTGAATIKTDGADSHGVYSYGSSSKVTLGNATRIDNSGSGSHSIYAYAGSVTGTGKFTLGEETKDASLYARNGTIDLVMNNASQFNGYSAFQSSTATGKINLDIKDNSQWYLSRSSELTKLTLDGTSSIVYTLKGTAESEYTSIYAFGDITLALNSAMLVVLDGYDALEGDEFTLLSVAQSGIYSAGDYGDVKFDFSRAQLGEGLAWDTTTFHQDGTIRVVALGIPEPSAALLGMLGLGVVFMSRKQRF